MKSDDVQAVPSPADLVGKWRLEVKDASGTRTSDYHFGKDGRIEIETLVELGDVKKTDVAKRAAIELAKDLITSLELSRTGADGVEDVIPPDRRRKKTHRFAVKDDTLTLTELDDAGKPLGAVTLKRVK